MRMQLTRPTDCCEGQYPDDAQALAHHLAGRKLPRTYPTTSALETITATALNSTRFCKPGFLLSAFHVATCLHPSISDLPKNLKLPFLIAFLVLTTSAVAETLTVRVSRLVPEETKREVLAMVEDARAVTGLDIRVQRRGIWNRAGDVWLELSPETMRDWERVRPRARAGDEDRERVRPRARDVDGADEGVRSPVVFREPVINLVSAWLQDTLGVIWPAPGEVARLPVEMTWLPFAEWREAFEADPPRGYLTRRFSGSRTDAAGRDWRRKNRGVEHFSFSHQHFRVIQPEHFEEHPYLFAKDEDGNPQRPPHARVTGFNDHPDLSEERVVDWIADAVVEVFDANPGRMGTSIAANDSFEFGQFTEDYGKRPVDC